MTTFLDRVTSHTAATPTATQVEVRRPTASCHFCGAQADADGSVLSKLGWLSAPTGEHFCGMTCHAEHRRVAPRYGHAPLDARPVVATVAHAVATTTSRAQAAAAKREIVGHVRCVRQGCGQRYELVSQLDGDGNLTPDPNVVAAMLGCMVTPSGWSCSKFCRDVMALERLRQVPIKAAEKLGDTTVARRLAPQQGDEGMRARLDAQAPKLRSR